MKYFFVKILMDNTLSVGKYDGDETFSVNDLTVILTKYGKDIGKILSGPFENLNNNKENVKILSKISEQEKDLLKRYKKYAEEATPKVKAILKKHNSEAHFVSCYYLLDGKKLIVNYTSESRIDFRESVKELASVFKIRIEMRQIYPREAARMICDIGICGLQCCCTNMNCFDKSITTSIMKEQGLADTTAKTIGPCGKLLCCLAYEVENYEHGRYKFTPTR